MQLIPMPDSMTPETGQSWQLTLYIVFIAQLLSIIGFAFTLPFLPFYIRELGVTEERLVPIWAGFIMASSSIVMAFFSPLWGWLADRHGRKIMVERAMFGGAVITFAMGLIVDVWQLLFLRLLAGAATGTISASIAMISTVVPRPKLGYSLGLLQVAVGLGQLLGGVPVLARLVAQVLRQPLDKGDHRLTKQGFVAILSCAEPLAIVVPLERAKKPQRVVREPG